MDRMRPFAPNLPIGNPSSTTAAVPPSSGAVTINNVNPSGWSKPSSNLVSSNRHSTEWGNSSPYQAVSGAISTPVEGVSEVVSMDTSPQLQNCPGVVEPLVAENKKGGARKNAWGGYSYADLISAAIKSSEHKRLTLAQIYEWIVNNIPYFRDKGEANSSAGWKVS